MFDSRKQSNDKLLLRVDETAEVLGVSRSTVYELIGSGELSTIKIGSRGVRVPYADVKTWVERNVRRIGGEAI